ncbi:MAG: methyltransferase domain-containing protein [Fibrobacteria bacterium]
MTENEILAHFASLDLQPEARYYIACMARRFAYLLRLVERFRAQLPAGTARIMDIGPSYFTELLSLKFPRDEILCVGFASQNSRGGHYPKGIKLEAVRFHAFDLNDTQDRSKWIEIPSCDIVVMAEVIEHVHTAPQLVYRFIQSFLAPGGALIVQTPNAAEFFKRIQLLQGKNPYELIRENAENPGHFREYTGMELRAIGEQEGLSCLDIEYLNYFPRKGRLQRLVNAITDIAAPTLREGITVSYRKT